MTAPLLIVCMGVSSCGKTTLARALADRFGLAYLEADDFHSEENKEQMARGIPLTDEMRKPWVDSICTALLRELSAQRNCVLACSALRKSHRQRFRETAYKVRFLWLDGSRELIGRWISEREGHFMSPELLVSQFSALQSPVDEGDVSRICLDQGWDGVLEEASRIIKTLTCPE